MLLECVSRGTGMSGHQPGSGSLLTHAVLHACGPQTLHAVSPEPATQRGKRRLPSTGSQEEQKRTGHCVLCQTPSPEISQHGETTSKLKRKEKKRNLGKQGGRYKQTTLCKGLLREATPVTWMLWALFCLHTSHHPRIKLHPILPDS